MTLVLAVVTSRVIRRRLTRRRTTLGTVIAPLTRPTSNRADADTERFRTVGFNPTRLADAIPNTIPMFGRDYTRNGICDDPQKQESKDGQ